MATIQYLVLASVSMGKTHVPHASLGRRKTNLA